MGSEQRGGREEPRVVADTVPVAAVRCDRDGRFLWVNQTYARWAARPPAKLIGVRIADIVGSPAMAEIQPFLERILQGEPLAYERRVELPGLGRRWVKWAYTPTLDSDGHVDGWVATGMDIHEAREGERKRDEFLATLAHELRNPLAPIRNAVAILGRKGSHDPEVAWSQGVIERQIEQLSRLIDDLLDIERISRGKFLLRRSALPLEAAIDMALEASRPHINAAGHHLSVLLPSERVAIDADATRLAQVFSTLLRNAARHMHARGSINLTATVESGAVLVKIEDAGIGIERGAEQGVGLTLVRGILALHQGSLELRPAESGQGTEAVVRLPLATEPVMAERRVPRADPAEAPPLRILVADDNRDAADSLQRILALYGHEVRVAYDGESALHVGSEFRPRVAILDIAMPGTNGYDVARALRRHHGDDVTLVALTGWGQDTDRRRASDAGFDHHLTKPVDPQTLNTLLADVAKNNSGPGP
ncbi:MAG: response regulator [Betaproteobacteria bacterium]|nr:MAG: response regulator [Betaproteobacteria bacterium]